MNAHIVAARQAEARAVNHKSHGLYRAAGEEFTTAAAEWAKAQVDAERAGENLIAWICEQERNQKREKAQQAADLEIWAAAC